MQQPRGLGVGMLRAFVRRRRHQQSEWQAGKIAGRRHDQMIDRCQLVFQRPQQLAIQREGRLDAEVRQPPELGHEGGAQIGDVLGESGVGDVETARGQSLVCDKQRIAFLGADDEGQKCIARLQ